VTAKVAYWVGESRTSVDAAIVLTAEGATIAAGVPFWPHARPGLAQLAIAAARIHGLEADEPNGGAHRPGAQ
jgi:hypothetical protein